MQEAPVKKSPEIAKIEHKAKRVALKPPSEFPFPVFTMCPPVYVDNAIANNVTIKELSPAERKIDKDKFLAQWFNFYNVLAANSLVYLITPVRGLQDQTYVNCYVYLPHIQDRDVIVLSNFTAPGREGEEDVACGLFNDLGYEIHDCPHLFEGEPELKWLGDNVYIGGYGARTDLKAHRWLEQKFGAKIISVKATDPVLYHLDCYAFPIGNDDVLLRTKDLDREAIRRIERMRNVIDVPTDEAQMGLCNSLQVEDAVFNASSLQYMKKTDKDYDKVRKKDQHLEDICRELGLDLTYFDLSECMKSGAMLSCFVGHLNYR